MDEIVLYHNPRCSKSRAALELLREHGVEPRVVEYLKTPLTREELETLRRRLGLEPSDWVRRGEETYAAAGLSAESPDDQLLDAMTRHPILIERPIALRGDRAVVGRPPERVLELL
jgi:arsenate reductase